MSDIIIHRKHGQTSASARASAEHMAAKLEEKFNLKHTWEGNLLRFKGSGVSGELGLKEGEVALRIRLGLLLTALKPAIEREVHKFFDENFPA